MIRQLSINESNMIDCEDGVKRDIDDISAKVNKVVHETDLHWQLYRSSLTKNVLPLERYRDFIRQYDYFVNAVKHYYYDGEENRFDSNFGFRNVINMLERSRREFENILPKAVFTNLEYSVNRLIAYIKSNFLGDDII